MTIPDYNRQAWDNYVDQKNRWTVPVSPEVIEQARSGVFQVLLTPEKPVPRSWFPEQFQDLDILGLACGGGQQGPTFSALGARVTIFDNSPKQLAQDELVSKREQLSLQTILGDMKDLSVFENQSFDLIFHPVSNCFAEHVQPVWNECFRVLRPGGWLLAGMMNPMLFQLDPDSLKNNHQLSIKYKAPYSDTKSLSDEERKIYTDNHEALVFGHSLEDQIGGQLSAGFVLHGFFEDALRTTSEEALVNDYFPACFATRAQKPER
jgi:SAM-dependent methyltransferase